MTNWTVERAEVIAQERHAGAVDKAGRPYIEHPRQVALLAEALRASDEEFEDVDPDLLRAAALLHDTLEDTTLTISELIEEGAPLDLLRALDALTHREGERYDDYVRRAAVNRVARLVKIADNAHNSSEERLALLSPTVAARLRRKYDRARKILEAVH